MTVAPTAEHVEWMRTETARRREFEAHVKEQLGYVKTAIDIVLKAMELEEKHYEELEEPGHG